MRELNLGLQEPKYNIQVSCSILYEIALDIASFTWERVHDKIDKGVSRITEMKARMSPELEREVQFSAATHSWRCILNLAHSCTELLHSPLTRHMDIFITYIRNLGDDVIALAAPYLGESTASAMTAALSGDEMSQAQLLRQVETNALIYDNLRYLFTAEAKGLAAHIERLLTGWSAEMLDADNCMSVLETSCDSTIRLSAELTNAELIKSITMGGEINPDPGVTTLWLIPQISYRPFTIRNHRKQTSVFYYPVSDKHLSGAAEHELLMRVASLHKAVGDVHRLRLLRTLVTDSKSLAELSSTIQSSKSATHHHLLLLRSAGLVTVDNGVYTMNHHEVEQLGPMLRSYLQIPFGGGDEL